jgi:dihydrolipoamide dehydrogenase
MYDLAILGGGYGGYVAAIRGAQRGLKVLVIEKELIGGTCLHRGCIPTKCFFYDGKILEEAKTSQAITGGERLAIDPRKMVARKKQVVKSLLEGLQMITGSYGIEVVQGLGELIAPGRIKVSRANGGIEEQETRAVILAMGSRPAVPAFIEVDGRYVQTTDEALDSEDIPDRLIIIGGGMTGAEMTGIYCNLGTEVTVLESLPDILTTCDQEVRGTMRQIFDQRGVNLHLGAEVQQIETQGNEVTVTFQDQGHGVKMLKSDRVLIATGRDAVWDGIDTKRLGLITDGPFVKVNERLETNLPGVYAIGDLIGGKMLAHKAAVEAEVAVDNIQGASRGVNYERIPRAIWAFTEIGAVGLTEEEARNTGRAIKIGKFPFMNSGAARTVGITTGFAKIIGDAETGEVLGFHIMGPHATDLIGEAVLAMTMESAVEEMAQALRPHPTLSETVMEAAMDWSGQAINAPKKS